MSYDTVELFTENSYRDYVGRGFTVHEALALSGDKLISKWFMTKDDVRNYACTVIFTRIGLDKFCDSVMLLSADDATPEDCLRTVGLSRKSNKLSIRILCDMLDVTDVYKEAFRLKHVNTAYKAEQTNFDRYGVANVSQSEVFKEKKRATCQEHWGADNYWGSEIGKQRTHDSVFEKYGVDNVSQSDEIKQKKCNTSMKHFNVPYTMQAESVRRKMSDSLRATLNLPESDEIIYPFQVAAVRDKAADTLESNLGVRNPFESPEIQERARATMLREHGADNPSKVPEFRAKRESTIFEEYGVDNVFKLASMQAYAKERMIEVHGVAHSMQIPESRAKARATWKETYGGHPMSNPDVRKKALETKIKNGSFNTSEPEEFIYQQLVDVFGEDDIKRQYSSDVYPWACDFYVVSRDMYIELNGHWSHCGHWFGSSADDGEFLTFWKSHSEDSVYYANAVHVWSELDVQKRETAKSNQLNYVVFWDGSKNCSDARIWFSMDCPDGRDWNVEYSWLPSRTLSADFAWPSKVTDSLRSINAVVNAANGHLFFEHEIDIWNNNDYIDAMSSKRYGTIQMYLYANRMQYMNVRSDKSAMWTGDNPLEISDLTLLRGFKISGLYNGYSRFDNRAMLQFLSKYSDVSYVYDPCCGWGERLITCSVNGIKYLGCDIRSELGSGYNEIISRYGFDDAKFVSGDAAELDMTGSNHDCVFTCPPYGNLEIYSDKGAENLGTTDFANWWQNVVNHSISSDTKYFAFQTNQALRDVFSKPLLDLGWKFADEFLVNSGKRPYSKTKKEYECVLVFVRS